MVINEVRKEDELYFQGPFWIISESQIEINRGNFEIIGERIPVDYTGNYVNGLTGKKGVTAHKYIWDRYKSNYGNVEYNYFPRGRVRIVSGNVFIHLNSKVNTPRVINAIIKFYGLEKLSNTISVEEDDLIQGSHYEFYLK